MVLKEYTLSELAQRLSSGGFWQGDVVPMTKHRALSHMNNPRARPEDVVLLVAYEGDKVVAHLGILPDLIYLKGREYRLGWLTAWWAKPDPKLAGVGLMLMVKAIKVYQGRIGASGFSDAAKRIYQATKEFVTAKEKAKLRVFLRADSRNLLPRKFPGLRRAKRLLGLLDGLLNLGCNSRLLAWKCQYGIGKQLRLEYLTEIDAETALFVEQRQGRELSKRGTPELNWIAQNPWVLAAPLEREPAQKFHFSATAARSSCLMVKVFDQRNDLLGFTMLRLIDGRLSVPYCCTNAQDIDAMFRVIGEHAVALQATELTLCRDDLRASLVRLRFPCLARKHETRSWIIGRMFQGEISGDVEVQDGDGDCAFC